MEDNSPVRYMCLLQLGRFRSSLGYSISMFPAVKQDVRFAQASLWIKNCIENHPSYAQQTHHRKAFLPTRLIDVSSRPYLRVTHGCGLEDARYVALSHSWSKNMPEAAKTSVSNLDSHLQGISEADLPLSFREAFAFAMFLKVSYVWIDSLCIIQDSAEDLQQEIAQMSKAYSCSYCTLATSNRNATHPRFFLADVRQILRSQDPPSNMQMKCHIPPDVRMRVERHLIFGQTTLSLNNITNQSSQLRRRLNWLDALNSISLSRRGWTLQERELSPRVFHYTPITALWECRSLRALEEDPCGFTDHGSLWHGILGKQTTVSRYRLLGIYYTKRKPMPFGLSLRIEFSGKYDEIYNSWLCVIEDYSERRLTLRVTSLQISQDWHMKFNV